MGDLIIIGTKDLFFKTEYLVILTILLIYVYIPICRSYIMYILALTIVPAREKLGFRLDFKGSFL